MVETNVKYAITVVVGLIVAILVSVISPVFSPFSDSIKKWITGEPDTIIISAFTFDLKNDMMRNEVNDTKPTIVTKSITFSFDAIQNSTWFGTVETSGFECSMDGAPFEDCVSPKSYNDLQTDAIHNFQVRAKGLLGNVDTSPDIFTFNIMTSATVQGVIRDNNQGNQFAFSLDSNSSSEKKNYTTDRLVFFVYMI